jgi:hypothetical protein
MSRRKYAAARPAMPPPITVTRKCCVPEAM